MGGGIDYSRIFKDPLNVTSDIIKETFTLGEAETETFNSEEFSKAKADERKAEQDRLEAERIAKEEAKKEQEMQTELSERMATGGYRSLIGGRGTTDTLRDKSLFKG